MTVSLWGVDIYYIIKKGTYGTKIQRETIHINMNMESYAVKYGINFLHVKMDIDNARCLCFIFAISSMGLIFCTLKIWKYGYYVL
mgnify:CR=1 FL=1